MRSGLDILSSRRKMFALTNELAGSFPTSQSLKAKETKFGIVVSSSEVTFVLWLTSPRETRQVPTLLQKGPWWQSQVFRLVFLQGLGIGLLGAPITQFLISFVAHMSSVTALLPSVTSFALRNLLHKFLGFRLFMSQCPGFINGSDMMCMKPNPKNINSCGKPLQEKTDPLSGLPTPKRWREMTLGLPLELRDEVGVPPIHFPRWVDHTAPSAWNLLVQEQQKCSFQLMPLALTASAAGSVSKKMHARVRLDRHAHTLNRPHHHHHHPQTQHRPNSRATIAVSVATNDQRVVFDHWYVDKYAAAYPVYDAAYELLLLLLSISLPPCFFLPVSVCVTFGVCPTVSLSLSLFPIPSPDSSVASLSSVHPRPLLCQSELCKLSLFDSPAPVPSRKYIRFHQSVDSGDPLDPRVLLANFHRVSFRHRQVVCARWAFVLPPSAVVPYAVRLRLVKLEPISASASTASCKTSFASPSCRWRTRQRAR